MTKESTFNPHNKEEYPPMHTVEHVVNGAMCKLFGTKRSIAAHIEQKKSRMDFKVDFTPNDLHLSELGNEINRVLDSDLEVKYEIVTQAQAQDMGVDLSRIPDEASDLVRIVKVGDYDTCLCIGKHVSRTIECGHIDLYAHSYNPDTGIWRLRFKLKPRL